MDSSKRESGGADRAGDPRNHGADSETPGRRSAPGRSKIPGAPPVERTTDEAVRAEQEMVQRSFRVLLKGARRFLNRTLDIRDDANIEGTIETIHKDMVFRGPNVWVLICSIFIASIGLNTNSAAVIIGAMLISPLMGPILAIGLSVGTNDIETLRRAVRNFVVMVVVALLTSTLYFLITPLGDVHSELLARTRPTLLDAAIALFGGIAGIIGVSRRDRGNVIPGVAIATALMPPLCTAGYGLANGNWPFFFGATYLFALNSIFIAISTVMIVRFLHFPFVKFMDSQARRRVRLRIAVFVAIVLLPSTWILYGVVRESLWRTRAASFVSDNLSTLAGVDIINQRLEYADTLSQIEVFLSGESLPSQLEDQLQTRMAAAGLGNTVLRLHQPQNVAGELGRLSSELRVGIVQDLYERNALALEERERRILSLEGELARYAQDTIPFAQITREVQTQYPEVASVAFGRLIEYRDVLVPAVEAAPIDPSDGAAGAAPGVPVGGPPGSAEGAGGATESPGGPRETSPANTAVGAPGGAPDALAQVGADTTQALPSMRRILDTIPTFMVTWADGTPRARRLETTERLGEWLKVRLSLDTVQVLGN